MLNTNTFTAHKMEQTQQLQRAMKMHQLQVTHKGLFQTLLQKIRTVSSKDNETNQANLLEQLLDFQVR